MVHRMVRSQIEFEIREPTGLRLGTYDIFTIRQKIYTGDLQPRCEYLVQGDEWAPLSASPLFSGVIWLVHRDAPDDAATDGSPKTAPRIAGWSSAAGATEQPSSPSLPAADAPKKKGLLSRFFGKG
jgi:hypothetical protein